MAVDKKILKVYTKKKCIPIGWISGKSKLNSAFSEMQTTWCNFTLPQQSFTKQVKENSKWMVGQHAKFVTTLENFC